MSAGQMHVLRLRPCRATLSFVVAFTSFPNVFVCSCVFLRFPSWFHRIRLETRRCPRQNFKKNPTVRNRPPQDTSYYVMSTFCWQTQTIPMLALLGRTWTGRWYLHVQHCWASLFILQSWDQKPPNCQMSCNFRTKALRGIILRNRPLTKTSTPKQPTETKKYHVNIYICTYQLVSAVCCCVFHYFSPWAVSRDTVQFCICSFAWSCVGLILNVSFAFASFFISFSPGQVSRDTAFCFSRRF